MKAMDIEPRGVFYVLMLAAAFCLIMMVSLASAHSWYGWECCSGGDCRPAYPGEVRQTPEGFEHVPSGQVLDQRSIKPSRDGEYHVCIPPDGVYRDGLKVKCIYVPFSS
jgi:hypothetical protein